MAVDPNATTVTVQLDPTVTATAVAVGYQGPAAAFVPGDITLLDGGTIGTSSTSPMLTFQADGTVVFNDDANFTGAISGVDTDDVGEASNLYYTTARANTAIDARVTKAFVDALNVDAATVGGELPSAFADAVHTHAASDVISGTFADARISQTSVTQHEAAINHDALTGFVPDEHVAHSGVTITAGTALSGGGSIDASQTINYAGAFTDQSDFDTTGLADNDIITYDLASGNFVVEAFNTQQATLTITESQISDLQSYLLATDIDTLAELNAIITDATLVDVTHTHTESDITDLDKYTQAQVDSLDAQVDANAIAYAIALG